MCTFPDFDPSTGGFLRKLCRPTTWTDTRLAGHGYTRFAQQFLFDGFQYYFLNFILFYTRFPSTTINPRNAYWFVHSIGDSRTLCTKEFLIWRELVTFRLFYCVLCTITPQIDRGNRRRTSYTRVYLYTSYIVYIYCIYKYKWLMRACWFLTYQRYLYIVKNNTESVLRTVAQRKYTRWRRCASATHYL